MSQFITTSEVRAVVGDFWRSQVMDIVRGATFVGALLLAWVSLQPFEDLSNMQIGDVTTGNVATTYMAYAALAVLTLALAMRDNVTALKTLLSPSFVLFAAWLCFTVVLSFDPATSIRRFSLTACVFAVAASLPLLAKSQHELMRWFSIAALTLLAICYLGILLAPHLSIHLATDPQEPGLAGNWRGSFGHKNMAAGIMAMLLFFGIYFIRAGAWIAGVSVIGLASLFLIYSAGKSSLTLCFAVLLLTSLTSVVRSFWARAVMMLMPLALLEHAQHRHRDERYACPYCKPVAAGRELYRPHRHLELCAAVAAAAIGDRLRLCLVLGQQRHPEPAGRQGVGGFRRPTATTAISTPRSGWVCLAWHF